MRPVQTAFRRPGTHAAPVVVTRTRICTKLRRLAVAPTHPIPMLRSLWAGWCCAPSTEGHACNCAMHSREGVPESQYTNATRDIARAGGGGNEQHGRHDPRSRHMLSSQSCDLY